MNRSNFEMPRVASDYLNPTPDGPDAPAQEPSKVQVASTLDHDGSTNQLTITRGDGSVQQFPAANNATNDSRGRWPDGTYHFERHTTHRDDAPDSAYGSNGNYIFTVPGRDKMGVHSGRLGRSDPAGRSGVNHGTLGCIRTTDEGTAAIGDAMTSGDPPTTINIRNNNR